jgi:hypothetical protein
MHNRMRVPDPPPDPAPDLTEWNQHRYDPGYYLGGKLPPLVRAYQRVAGRTEKSLIGMLLLFYLPVLPDIAAFVPRPYNFILAAVVTAGVAVGFYLANRAKSSIRKARDANALPRRRHRHGAVRRGGG